MRVALQSHQAVDRLQQHRADSSHRSQVLSSSGFTIVELLIVMVIIGILAALVIVAYNGIKTRAEDASLQSEASQAGKMVLAYKSLNSDALPADMPTAGVTAGAGHDLYYRVTPDGKHFCVAVSITGSPTRAYSVTSTNDGAAKRGTCQGYILVPGNANFGTRDFWVMKYEAKNVNGVAMSQASSSPWTNRSQPDFAGRSQSACDGCHLISEAEWMTLAGNVLGVNSNWSGGSVGSGFIYSGHNDNTPASALEASSNDGDGYSNTGSTTGSNQRRTLTLSNGEVIWDLAGNAWEWTAQSQTVSNVGNIGDSGYMWREWTNPSLSLGNLPSESRPSALVSSPGLSLVTSWNSTKGVGAIFANYSDNVSRGFPRGGYWNTRDNAGVLSLTLDGSPSTTSSGVGFRVAR